MKIIKIKFGPKSKIYSYLLSAGTVVNPNPGNVLYNIKGCSDKGEIKTPMTVVGIEEVPRLPSYVTSSITVLNLKLECNVYTISEENILKLRGEKTESEKRFDRINDLISKTFMKILKEFAKEE